VSAIGGLFNQSTSVKPFMVRLQSDLRIVVSLRRTKISTYVPCHAVYQTSIVTMSWYRATRTGREWLNAGMLKYVP